MGGNNGRNTDGAFAPGNPGRPKGARHKATQAALALLHGEAKVPDPQGSGNSAGRQRGCAAPLPGTDRPNPQGCPRDLPASAHAISAADAAKAAGAVLDAVALGNLTPPEGAQIMGLVDGFRRALETSELGARVAALEAGAA